MGGDKKRVLNLRPTWAGTKKEFQNLRPTWGRGEKTLVGLLLDDVPDFTVTTAHTPTRGEQPGIIKIAHRPFRIYYLPGSEGKFRTENASYIDIAEDRASPRKISFFPSKNLEMGY